MQSLFVRDRLFIRLNSAVLALASSNISAFSMIEIGEVEEVKEKIMVPRIFSISPGRNIILVLYEIKVIIYFLPTENGSRCFIIITANMRNIVGRIHPSYLVKGFKNKERIIHFIIFTKLNSN